MPQPSPDALYLIGLGLAWTLWFALHSWLASNSLKARFNRLFPALAPRYRLIYNGLAVFLLIPPAWLLLAWEGPWLWRWDGNWAWISHSLVVLALFGFWITTRHYDMDEFLGLKNADGGTHNFRLSPLHRYVRHPWYFLGLILLWSQDMDVARLVVSILASLYLWLGSRLEDRKLVEEFGDTYREYCRRVGGILPFPGKQLSRSEARELILKRRGPR